MCPALRSLDANEVARLCDPTTRTRMPSSLTTGSPGKGLMVPATGGSAMARTGDSVASRRVDGARIGRERNPPSHGYGGCELETAGSTLSDLTVAPHIGCWT